MFKIFMYIVFAVSLCFIHTAPTVKKNVIFEDNISGANVEDELGQYFEGDILLTPSQEEAIESAKRSRNGLRDAAKRWPNRTVVYHIEEDDFDEDEIEIIHEAMEDIAKQSCIKFRARHTKEQAVVIKGSASGCFSNVGFVTADDEGETEQVLNLAEGCFKHGTVVHEMLHTLGFFHMQSSHDRDDFVQIIWENIKPGTEHNFAKYTANTVTDFGVPYDYDSVMHYPEKAFTKNGNKTIVPLKDDAKIGQRKGMSEGDVLKINRMYCEDNQDLSISYIV